jgi:hypothetical protein
MALYRWMRPFPVALTLLLAACGGSSSSDGEVRIVASGGGEASAEASARTLEGDPLPPVDTSRSDRVIIDEPYKYIIRVELAPVRDTPLEPEVRRLLAAIPQWRPVLAATDLDPIREIDAIIAASPGRGSRDYVMLARHASRDDRVRGIVELLARAEGTELAWTTRDGVAAALWPGEPEVVQSVAIIRPGWVAIGPSAEVSRFAAIAAREGGELLPGIPMPWDGEHSVVDDGAGLQATGRGLMGDEGQLPYYPDRFELLIENDAQGNVGCGWTGFYPDAAEAESARAHWESRRAEYADNPLLSLFGLASAVQNARFTIDGPRVAFRLDLTLLQMSRLIRFATPMLVGASRRG